MIDVQITIDNLEQNIRWIEEIECHQFPGWGNATVAMRDAVGVIEAQRREIESLQSEIEELTQSYTPKYFQSEYLFPYCGNCGKLLPLTEGTLHHMKYCGECGRKVDWSV